MNFLEAVKAMEEGKYVRRTDWRYPVCALLFIDYCNCSNHFYIKGKYDISPDEIEGYGIGYPDVRSENWETINIGDTILNKE